MSSVDVVIPCYNYARFLPQCVGSVLSQQGVEVRVLIIDDTSPDDTPEVGQRLAAQDQRVQFRRHPVNRGHIATYNEGLLDWASAKYSLLLSADDLLMPGALLRATRLMDQNPEVGFTYGMARLLRGDAEPDQVKDGTDEYQIVSGPRFIQRLCAFGNEVPTPAAVVRTEWQQRLGGYKSELPHSGDMEMWMRFAAHGPVGVLRADVAYYRVHGSNMSVKTYAQLIGDRREQVDAVRTVYEKWSGQVPGFESWFDAMRRRIAEEVLWTASAAFDAGNGSAARDCMTLAEEIHPDVRQLRVWRTMSIKRRLGTWGWSVLRPLVRRSQERAERVAALPAQRIGWWPQQS